MNRLLRAGTLLGLAAALAGCVAASEPEASPPTRQRLAVLTTIAPITLFTRAVGGDCAEVRALLPPGIGPHGFQSRPQDLLELRRAQVLVVNGLGLETFLEPLLRSAAPAALRVIDSSRSVATLAYEPAAIQSKPHQRQDHGPEHGHDHGDGGVNPHIWLDPLRAVQQVETIRDGLIAADPGCAAGYRRRAAATTQALRRLDADLAIQLRPLRGNTFVVLHDFAPYFAARYGLRAEFLVETPEQAPSPSDLQRVSEAVRRSGIRVLLSPPADASGVFDTLARDLGVRVAPFSPLEVLSESELADPATYSRIQRRNAMALRRAFIPSGPAGR